MSGKKVSLVEWLSRRLSFRCHTNRRGMAARSSHTMNAQKVYPKDSLDRFGDDLCQHLLSFLSLEDRFRCECVSKQWQRVVYETQMELIIDTKTEDSIESILRKCENMTRIEFSWFTTESMNDTTIDCITKHCNHLNAIYFSNYQRDLNMQTIDKFFAKFAKQLETIKVINSEMSIINNFKLCTHLTKLSLYTDSCLSYTLSGDQSVAIFPRLKRFGFYFNNGDVNSIEMFAQNYSQCLQSIEVYVRCFDEQSVDILMSSLSRMQALIDLKICYEKLDILSHGLPLIGHNLKHLKRLSISTRIFNDDPDQLVQLTQIMNANFTQLKRLSIVGPLNPPIEPIDCIRHIKLNRLKRLTHLEIIPKYCNIWIDGEFLVNISQHFPRLQSLELWLDTVSDISMDSLARLKNLRSIRLSVNNSEDLQPFVAKLADNCHKLKLMNKIICRICVQH